LWVVIVSTPVFVGSRFVAEYPEGGGNFWVPLQYIFGLRQHAVDAFWLELLSATGSASEDQKRIVTFFAHTERLGLEDRVLVLYLPDGRDGDQKELISPKIPPAEIAARMRQGLLLNFNNSIPKRHRADFARAVLYDIDPGMMQLWSTQWGMGVGEHDVYLTIGRQIGEPECPVPTLDIEWHRFWPTVYLPEWPSTPAGGARYTTITQWWNGKGGYDVIDGEIYDHNKRNSFLSVIDMPLLTGLEMELAANITPGETEDRALLAANGWGLAQPHEVANDPWSYRCYIQASRGEFSCAKPSIVKTAPGWISDRTVCYLASGRPCVVQATGAECHLPRSLGLQFFHSKAEAVEALRAVECNYERAAHEARRLAEDIFATDIIIQQLINILGLSTGPG
jgi:hypothetical protein